MGKWGTGRIGRGWFGCAIIGIGAASLMGCAGANPGAGLASTKAPPRCARIDGTDIGTPRGNAVCAAESLGGDGNRSAAHADGEGARASAVAGSLDLFDNKKPGDYLASNNNSSLAVATNGAGALARSGVNQRGTKGRGGNNAVARADGSDAFADASSANGNNNIATAAAEGCIGAPGQGCAFSAAGSGDNNAANAIANGRGSRAQAGALDGDRNRSVSGGKDGGRAFSNAQGGNGNSADSVATGDSAFASAQATGGDSVALSRADGANATASATGRNGGAARALADGGATATATAVGKGASAMAFASGAGTSASATQDGDNDTGTCSGPGVSFAMTAGKFHCVHGF